MPKIKGYSRDKKFENKFESVMYAWKGDSNRHLYRVYVLDVRAYYNIVVMLRDGSEWRNRQGKNFGLLEEARQEAIKLMREN